MSFRSRARFASARFALAALLAAPAAAGEVWILDQPPVGPFPTIQRAIDAAPEGALVLVDGGSGVYDESPLVDGKSLSIVATPGSPQPNVRRSLRIRNLAAHQRVIVRGLHVELWTGNPNTARVGPGARLENDLGAVWFEGCHFDGGRTDTRWPWDGEPALDLSACAQVVVKDCVLHAGPAGYCPGCEPTDGGDALQSLQSAVALFGCELVAGMGSNETSPSGGHGGHGARVEGYGIVASGCTLEGGDGGGADYVACDPGGDGGDGLRIVGAQAKLLATMLGGGAGGAGACNNDGAPGAPIDATTSTVDQHPGPSRSISATSLAPEHALVDVHVNGAPGDRVVLFFADEPGFHYVPALNGLWAIEPEPNVSICAEGILPASGVLDLSLALPPLPPNRTSHLHFLQALCRSAGGESFLSAPSPIWVHGPPIP